MKILIVSYYFPPSQSVGAKRAYSLRNSLIEAGHDVDVICANWAGKKILGVIYIGSKLLNANNASKKSNKKRKLFSLNTYFRSIDSSLFSSFVTNSVKYLFKNQKNSNKYSMVIVSYKPSASIIIGIVASRLAKSPLIVELRDLISIFGRKKRRRLLHLVDTLLDKLMISFANRLVVVSPTAKKYAELFYKREVDLVFNGIENREVAPLQKTQNDKKYYKIFYAGTLSQARRLDNISRFIKEYTGSRSIRLIVASRQDPADYGGDSLEVEWLGFVDREKVYELQQKADFLLMLEGKGADSIENIPAKIYEYLGAARPIIADCNQNSDIISVLKNSKRGTHVFSSESFREAIDRKWKFADDDVYFYLRDTQNKNYLKLIDKLVSKKI